MRSAANCRDHAARSDLGRWYLTAYVQTPLPVRAWPAFSRWH